MSAGVPETVYAHKRSISNQGSMLNAIPENRRMHLTSQANYPESIEVLLSRAVETLQDCFIVTDTAGTIQYANTAAARLFRLDAPNLIDQSINELLLDEHSSNFMLRRALLGGWQGEITARKGTGQTFAASISASGLRDPQGYPDGIAFVIRDITPQKRREQELERANQIKSDFLAHISHELRTPLTSIMGFSSVLEKQIFGLLNPKQAQYVGQIHQSGKYLLSLINDVLDLSKIEAGQMELEVQSVCLNDICDSAIALVSEQARVREIEISLRSQDELVIPVDELRIKQVLVNLLANAVKFSHDGGQMGIDVQLTPLNVEICVWDEGIGIPQDQQHRLFQPFQQLNGAYSKLGTGLGLALSRRLVELHEGYLTVESIEGQGSRFTICLPLALAAQGV
jgi:PAS domain S-box-containing protein